MTLSYKRMSSRTLAEYFLTNTEHRSIIPVLISIFGLTDTTCFDNDPELLDVLFRINILLRSHKK